MVQLLSRHLKAGAFYLSTFLFLFSLGVKAQVRVSATAATTGPTSYTTLKGAFDALNAGTHQGIITITITGNTTETATATLNASGNGAASYSSVNIKPETGATPVISGNINGGPLIRCNGSRNLTIDGSNNGTTSRNLTITNTSTSGAYVVLFGSAGTTPISNVSLKNCTLINGTNTSFAVILGDAATAGNPGYFNNITLQNNSIQKAYIGVYCYAIVSAGNGNNTLITENDLDAIGANAIKLVGVYVQGGDGVTVSNNNIGNFESASAEFDRAIWFATGTKNSTISGNTIYNMHYTAVSSYAPIGLNISPGITNANITIASNTIRNLSSSGTGNTTGIYSYSASSGITVSGNQISNISNTNTAGYGAAAIILEHTINTAATKVYNNFVWGVSASGFNDYTSGDNGNGIVVNGGGGYDIDFNTVVLNTNAMYTAAHKSSCLLITNNVITSGSINVRNNIFANLQTTGNATSRLALSNIAASGNGVFGIINYNSYYSASGNLSSTGTNASITTTLAQLKTSLGGNANSVNINPVLTTANDLHLVTPQVQLAGTPTTGITTDIDGEARNAGSPYMGADEYGRRNAPDVNGILYVKKGSTGSGSSWAYAAPELADALVAAKTNTAIKEIWVAGGTYTPLYSPSDNNFGIPAGRDNAFLMVKDVQIYGGFAGTETSLAQRDLSLVANRSILSGDFTGDDLLSGSGTTLGITGNAGNAYHVVVAAGAIGTGSLDGFTITGGNANQVLPATINLQQTYRHRAGGMYLVNSAPQLRSLNFHSNQAETGGAIYTGGNAVVEISKTVFMQNLARTGAAVSSENIDNLVLSSCQFTANASLDGPNGYGGAIISAGGRLYVQNCLFAGNAASASGGAIWAEKIAVLSNSSFTGNSSADAGAAIFIRGINLPGGLSIPVINCSFANNQSPNSAVFDWPLTASNTGSVFEVNFINSIVYNGDNSIRLGSIPRAGFRHSILQQSGSLNPAFIVDAASISLRNQDPLFTDADGADDIFGTADDNLSLKPGSLASGAGNNTDYEAADGNTGNNSLNQDKDLADNARLVGVTIDIGAYESTIQPQTINPIADINKTYGDASFEPGATATSGLTVAYASADNTIAEAFQDAADGNKWKLNIKKAGHVNITASQAGGDGFSPATDVVFSFTINKKPVTVSIKATATFSKTYDAGTAGTFQVSDLELIAGDIIGSDEVQLNLSSATAQYDSKDAGTGKTITLPIANVLLSGAQASNYSITNVQDLSSATGVIFPMPLTITANNTSKVFDGLAYTGGNGVSYSSFALGESATQLSGTLTFSGTAQNAVNTGAYSIIPAGLSSPNYTIAYVNGQLTISLNNVNILAFNAQTAGSTLVKTYGDADINASVIASSGLAANYHSSNAMVATVNTSGQVTLLAPGTAIITVSQPGDANYGPATPITFQVQVAKKLLTVTANDFRRLMMPFPMLVNDLRYNGFVNGDGPAV